VPVIRGSEPLPAARDVASRPEVRRVHHAAGRVEAAEDQAASE
jgi:hypothetical protein